MNILVDVMGGDRAPIELLRGVIDAAAEYTDVSIEVIGDEKALGPAASLAGISLDRIRLRHAPEVILMEDAPMAVVREKPNSSMALGLRALRDGEADAFVSCGNTGALLTGGTLTVRRLRGIHRAAIGVILPFASPILLMDAGANIDLTSQDMRQLAYMGSRYMTHLYGMKSPRVGQINNGTEEGKGRSLQIETYLLLTNSPDVCFVGNVEGKALPFSPCDVLLTDGFTGNILLKFTEGIGKYFSDSLRDMLGSGCRGAIAAFFLRRELKAFKSRFDASEHGGAPLLGLAKPVIKAHGGSDGRAMKNAIRQAIRFAASDYANETAAYTDKLRARRSTDEEREAER